MSFTFQQASLALYTEQPQGSKRPGALKSLEVMHGHFLHIRLANPSHMAILDSRDKEIGKRLHLLVGRVSKYYSQIFFNWPQMYFEYPGNVEVGRKDAL